MKIPRFPGPRSARALRLRRAQAFTLAEMMVAVSIFIFMVLGVIYAMMFGMRYDQLICSKLGASDKSRISFDLLTAEIRSAKRWQIGNGNSTSFTAIPNLTLQKGNALQLLSDAANTNAWVRYFFDTNAYTLCRKTNGAATYQILAQNMTNVFGDGMTFQGQDYRGGSITTNTLSDLQHKYVVVTTMEFCLYQYPLTRVGPGYYYNYYRIQYKTASHCPD